MFQAQINQEAQKFNATLGEWLTHQQIHSEKCGDTPVIAVHRPPPPGKCRALKHVRGNILFYYLVR